MKQAMLDVHRQKQQGILDQLRAQKEAFLGHQQEIQEAHASLHRSFDNPQDKLNVSVMDENGDPFKATFKKSEVLEAAYGHERMKQKQTLMQEEMKVR